MAISVSSIIQQFGVMQKPVTVLSDIRLNITKRKESVLYRTTTTQANINLAYIVNDELNSIENIFISDKSIDLPANKIPEDLQPIVFHGRTITLPVDRFKATDVFITSVTQSKVPLFFKHVLKNFNTLNVSITLHDFSIRDNNFKVVVVPNTYIDKVNGILYSNLENNKDVFYYVHYSIKDNISNNIISYTEILDNELVFKQATIDDIDNTGQLIHDHKVYLIEGFSSNTFEVAFPIANDYAILEAPNSRIHLLKPPSTGNQNTWFLSVSNGSFFTNTFYNTIIKYNIPEFNTQLFSPEAPFKFRQSDICEQIDNKVLRTLKQGIVIDANKFVDVILRNSDNTPRFAFTTNPSKLNLAFENTAVYQNGIRSIDRLNGFIDLSINILDTDIIEASYYYEEQEYEIIDIDFNPINNSNILGKRLVFYTVPNTTDARSKTLYYLIVNNKGIIEVGNQTDNTSLTADIATNTFTYDVPSVDALHLNFIDKYSIQASDIFITSLNPNYFILGNVFVDTNKHASDAVIFDIRKLGGGIKKQEGLLKQLAQIDPEVSWTADAGFFDGMTYPGNASVFIELPVYLQKQNNGLFNDIELREIVERHIGLGVYSIIRSYGTNIKPIVEVL